MQKMKSKDYLATNGNTEIPVTYDKGLKGPSVDKGAIRDKVAATPKSLGPRDC